MIRLVNLFFILWTVGQISAQSYWQSSDIPLSAQRSDDAMYMPLRYAGLELDEQAVEKVLSKAVHDNFTSGNHIVFELPMPNGEIQRFYTYESPVMAKKLADKYPSIKTYKGLSEDGKSIARFGYSPRGFHATIRTPEGEIYIDKVSRSTGAYYASYFVKDHGEPNDSKYTKCGTEHEPTEFREEAVGVANRNMGVDLHTYDMALACTGVWGQLRGTKENALADMVTTVNRLNQIYENEAGFNLRLIADNDKLIQLDPTNDGYFNVTEGRSLLQQNTGRVNSLVGNGSYDIGHIYTNNCTDVGGVAALASICNNSNKAAGVTCHYASLLYITVQVASHEIGHQLSAQHTFNNCSDSSGDNSNASIGNDFEPGSGSTIMSYGGLCGQNNVQGNNDDYYNNASLVQIYNRTRNGGALGCAEKTPTDNITPEANIEIEDGFHIPVSTYFVLEGVGTDENDDNLTYCWEQKNGGGPTCDLGNPILQCAAFRSFRPVEEPYRFFPRPQRIFSNSGEATEVLPTYKRELTFRFTVRDNNPDAGMAHWDEINFNVDDSAGPFRVLSPGLSDVVEVGSNFDVTWDVANTDNALVNCQRVDIYLSLNKALHESDSDLILLAEGLPNNGKASVIVPSIAPTNQARILVKASNNIFFDVTDQNFIIEEASTPKAFFALDSYVQELCLPGSASAQINTAAIGGYQGSIAFSTEGMPTDITANFSSVSVNAGDNASVEFTISEDLPTGSYEWDIIGVSDSMDTIRRTFYVDVISTDFSDLMVLGPEDGLKGSAGLPTFNWQKASNATSYFFELATNPAFDPEDVVFSTEVQDTFYTVPSFLEKATVYYYRVKGLNVCGEGDYTFVRSLGTANLDCATFAALDVPIKISASSAQTVKSKVNIPSEGEISEVYIKNLIVQHDNFKDLKGRLTSPSGETIRLWDPSCPKSFQMNGSFNDNGSVFFNGCISTVNVYKPKDSLSRFVGENPKGLWELTIEDNKGGSGGEIKKFELEVCGAITSNPPVLVKNEVLQIQPFNRPKISFNYLLSEDVDNTPNELVYTLVKNVEHGELTNWGGKMEVGDKFTQYEIDEGRIYYENTSDADFDAFHFVVEDGNGGWIEITQFNIEIDESFPSSINDVDLESEVKLYPNPSSNYVNIEIGEKAKKLRTLIISDIHGKVLSKQGIHTGLHQINTTSLINGVYLVTLTDGKTRVMKKIVIQK